MKGNIYRIIIIIIISLVALFGLEKIILMRTAEASVYAPLAMLDTVEPAGTAEPAPTTAAPTLVATPVPSPDVMLSKFSLDGLFGGAILQPTADAGQAYIDGLIFVGDSTTLGFKVYGILKDGRNTRQVWTPACGTITIDQADTGTIVYPETGLEMPIAEAARLSRPNIMVITLGINGLAYLTPDQMVAEYDELIQGIRLASPGTKIILQSIFPVTINYGKIPSINNRRINDANFAIAQYAQSKGIKFLNSAAVLKDKDGYLDMSLDGGDGLHLNPDGYYRILGYMATHAYP